MSQHGGFVDDGNAESLTQKKRSSSPAPTSVSLKSYQSKGQSVYFKEESHHDLTSVLPGEQMILQSYHIRGQGCRDELSTLFKDGRGPGKIPEGSSEQCSKDSNIHSAEHELCDSLVECRKVCQQKFKLRLKKKFQTVFEGVPVQGNPAFLEKIYIELHITEGGHGGINAEHEVRQVEMASRQRSVTERDTLIRCNDIFRPLPGQDRPLRTVLTKGVAGVGKSVSVQKFILDWAEGNANQDVHFIFPLPFRELNLIKDKKCTLMDIINDFLIETKLFTFSNQDRYNIAFIFDGLDESRFPLDFQHNEAIYSVTEPASVDALLTNLIKGNLLPSALVWITSRPAAANQIPPECVDHVTEVRGFNDTQKEGYFRKKIKDKELASKIISHLKSSRTLYIMCHIPVFCLMSATVLECILTETERGAIPTCLTEMYIHFLIIQTKHRSEKYGNLWNLKTILSLGKLAFQQLEKGNLIFYEEDLRECGIDVKEASVYSGVCTQLFREEAGLYQGRVFCFVHLSIQEFLAALYVLLHFSSRVRHTSDQHQTSQLSSLLKDETSIGLHRTAVDLALQIGNGYLDLFLRFLLGLSLESNQKLLQDLLPQTGSSSLNTEETVKYIKQKIREAPNPERCINLFHCLNELNDHSLVEEVQNYLKKGRDQRDDLSLSQLSALAFVLLLSNKELEAFDLGDYGQRGSPARSDAGLLRMLPLFKASQRLKLRGCSLTEKSCAALSSALSSNSSSLRQLDLSENKLRDSGLQLLFTGLEHPNCKLEKLQLRCCRLTRRSCVVLSSALRSNSSSLRQLDLGDNNLGDSGVELLATGLDHPNCKLEKLELINCHLTAKCCAIITSVLSLKSLSLRQLDLTDNNLGDSGVELLSNGLKHPNCKLESLGLKWCFFTEKSCAALSSALSSNSSSLRQLNLNDNNLRDSGVELLSTGLGHPNCKLEKLELQKCNLTVRSCTSLASALRSNPSSLTELDLRYNRLQSGAELLSALQKDPKYKLTNLL